MDRTSRKRSSLFESHQSFRYVRTERFPPCSLRALCLVLYLFLLLSHQPQPLPCQDINRNSRPYGCRRCSCPHQEKEGTRRMVRCEGEDRWASGWIDDWIDLRVVGTRLVGWLFGFFFRLIFASQTVRWRRTARWMPCFSSSSFGRKKTSRRQILFVGVFREIRSGNHENSRSAGRLKLYSRNVVNKFS